MIPRIIQYHLQDLCAAVSSPQPLEKCQKAHPVLLRSKYSHQAVTFHIIGVKHITHPTFTAISSTVTVYMADPRKFFNRGFHEEKYSQELTRIDTKKI